MASLLNKFGSFGAVTRVSTNAIPNYSKFDGLKEITNKKKITVDTSSSLLEGKIFKRNLRLWQMSVTSGISCPTQVRMAHTDVLKVPDFSKYRLEETMRADVDTRDTDVQRRTYGYTMMFAGSMMTVLAAKQIVTTLLTTMLPNEKTLAEARVEIDISTVPEGKNVVFKWRNKPLFVRHRTQEEIAREEAVPQSELRHPQSDSDRVHRPEWLVVIGICTHLGCVPIANAGDFFGYYCPCHGSHYDGSGRIRKGPAPENLPVPEYKFINDTTILVG